MSILYKIFNDSGLTALTNYIKTTRAKAVSNEAAIGGLGEDLAGLSGEVVTALDNKQNKLTFDTTPTAGSTNPVTSGGVKNYVDSSIVQSDLSQTDNTAKDYVKGIIRKESLPEGYPYITKKIIEWDGDITDKVAVSGTFYKVSDEIPSNDELKESGIMYVTQNANQTTSSTNISQIWNAYISYGTITSDYAFLEYFAVIRSANTEIKGTTFPEPGIYFTKLNDTSWTTKLDYSIITKLDNKYFDSAYIIDVEVGQTDDGKTTYTLTNGNFNDAYIAYLNKKIIVMQMDGYSGNTLVCTGSDNSNRLEFVQLTEELNCFTIETLQLRSNNTISVYQKSNLAYVDHTHEASKISAGTFAGQVVAKSSGQTPGTMLLRNSKLVSAEETPTVNGEICWVYS